jgi:hypothetical protein
MILVKIPEKTGGFVQIRAALSSPLQSDGLCLTVPAVQRFAGGAKTGGMGKSGEAVEARGPSKNMRNGHKQ